MNSPVQGDVLATPAPGFATADAELIARRHFGLAGTARPLASERDQNFLFQAADGSRYVLKIANAAEAPAVLAFQTGALLHIAARDPDLPIPQVRPTTADAHSAVVERDGSRHVVRMLSFVDGTPLGELAATPALRRNLGRTTARLDRALRGYRHPAARHDLLWDLHRAARLCCHLPLVRDPRRRELALATFERHRTSIEPRLAGLRSQVIHNDCNPDNVLVAADGESISGIIDFGDMLHGALVADPVVAAAYQLLEQPDPLAAACEVIAAYHGELSLRSGEIELLYDLIATRLAMSAVICTWRGLEHPDNRDYILGHNELIWQTLARWRQIDAAAATAAFDAACPLTQPGGSQFD